MWLEVKFKRSFDAYHTGKIPALVRLRDYYPDAGDKKILYLGSKQHLVEKLSIKVYGNLLSE